MKKALIIRLLHRNSLLLLLSRLLVLLRNLPLRLLFKRFRTKIVKLILLLIGTDDSRRHFRVFAKPVIEVRRGVGIYVGGVEKVVAGIG